MAVGRGLMPQEIAVCTRVKVCLIARARLFADGERDGAVGIALADRGDDGADLVVGIVGILAALQDKGAESERIALAAAGEDVHQLQPVAGGVPVSVPDAAVVAVVFAVVGKFDESAHIDRVAVSLTAHRIRRLAQQFVRRVRLQQRAERLVRQVARVAQRGNPLSVIVHGGTS